MKEERVTPKISEELTEELKRYMDADLEVWVEGWNPEHIAFRYFNVMQEYKIKHDVSVENL